HILNQISSKKRVKYGSDRDILCHRRLLYTTKNKLERENTFVRWFEKETEILHQNKIRMNSQSRRNTFAKMKNSIRAVRFI
ncbi:hypothetical protein, partial [Leptospira alexanderi]|uniref:hypothetical protein n=1 Tax=Leptospira alexanderi TaxID=100053 RepID=UPI001C37D72A